MSRHLSPDCFYDLPSGNRVHPCRLIFKDGTLMWKHALLEHNTFVSLPKTQAHESHIIKTAQRIEELNSWVAQDLDPWEFLKPQIWYTPNHKDMSEGISLIFKHTCLSTDYVYDALVPHLHEFEVLNKEAGSLYFRRC